MTSTAIDLISHVISGEASRASDVFDDLIAGAVTSALEARKVEVARGILGEPVDEEVVEADDNELQKIVSEAKSDYVATKIRASGNLPDHVKITHFDPKTGRHAHVAMIAHMGEKWNAHVTHGSREFSKDFHHEPTPVHKKDSRAEAIRWAVKAHDDHVRMHAGK
jgi:hypothetical protein